MRQDSRPLPCETRKLEKPSKMAQMKLVSVFIALVSIASISRGGECCETALAHIFQLLSSFSFYFADELLDSLNGVQKFMTGKDEFDKVFYKELVSCLNQIDDQLLESVNAQWRGFREYAASKGSPEDPWPQCKGTRVI